MSEDWSEGRAPFTVGDRIRVTGVLPFGDSRPGEADPSAPPVGAEGTVTWVNTWRDMRHTRQFHVDWDGNGLYVSTLLGSDPFIVLPKENQS
jgi:hypothetical protein